MAKAGDYKISDIYQGGTSSLNPSYGSVFTGYRTGAGELGLSTDPRTANILQEVSSKLSTGIKTIELSLITPAIFESIPQQQLKEINRLSKLTGVDMTVHGLIVEPSGFTQEGYSEDARNLAERQMNSFVERTHEINPKGNSPITFHSSVNIPGEIPQKGEKPKEVFVIDADRGSIHRLPVEKERWTGEPELEAKTELRKINEEVWKQQLSKLASNTYEGVKIIDDSTHLALGAEELKKEGKSIPKEMERAVSEFNTGKAILNDSYRGLKELFKIAKKHTENENEMRNLAEFVEKIKNKSEKIEKDPKSKESVQYMKEIVQDGISVLNEVAPQKYRPFKEFAMDKAVTTFTNVAIDSYKKFRDNAPIISIENPPAGGAFSTGEELKQLVEMTRDRFVQNAVKPKDHGGLGMSEKEAEIQAEKLIGVTWDVGHINQLRRFGYGKEDIIKEAEKIAPLLKHVHLSDNFGLENVEMPMGMGNVSTKEVFEKLGEKGREAKKIIEAAAWWEHMKTPPIKESFEAFGSPLYTERGGPYWNQTAGLEQGYFTGYGAMLPQINYEIFGAGFSQLPTELGGQRRGAEGGRLSGRPME